VKPEPAAFASDEAAVFGLGGPLGSTISGSGSCKATPADPAGGGSDRTGRDAPGGRETLFRRPSSNGSRGSWGGSSAGATATTSAAPPTAQSSTAAPGTESADRAAKESIAPTAPPAGWPWRRACAVRSSRPMAHSENVNQDPARANDSRGRPTTSAQATARKKIAIA